MSESIKNHHKEEETELTALEYIHIKGARSNNLKNIELRIPKDKLIVVTGLSGSGKSSLIMDTLFAEGQRRYVESLSSYARQFLSRMKKPEVDFIKGLCPAIAIEQRTGSSNARSTVGSLTEIYDYLRILYARIGKTFSPISGKQVIKHQVSDVVSYIFQFDEGDKVMLLSTINRSYTDLSLKQELELLMQKGYSRVIFKDRLQHIDELVDSGIEALNRGITEFNDQDLMVLVDRFVINDDEENRKRIADSVQTAFLEGEGDCLVEIIGKETYRFNNRFELDGLLFPEPSPQLFNYNNPYGACPTCEGYGKILGVDHQKVFPDDSKTVYEGAIACWKGEKSEMWLNRLIRAASLFEFPIHRPINELTEEQYELLWSGNEYFEGIDAYFAELESKSYKIQNRVLMARYRGRTICSNCKGGRLRKEASYVKIDGRQIMQLVDIPIDELIEIFQSLSLDHFEQQIANRILLEINNRLDVMQKVGLGYLSLNRISSSLSGGETQRINLTRTLGSNLSNSLYILDEPSIGLHPKDTARLVDVLKTLRDLGNTVIVVEHEEEVIKNADFIIDIGPLAGIHGGEVVAADTYTNFLKSNYRSLTADYLLGKKQIPIPSVRRKAIHKIQVHKARQHNLKNIDVEIPIQAMTAITGISGSGKTSLVKHIIYPALKKVLDEPLSVSPGKFEKLTGDLGMITGVEYITQSPIGRSSRSNPITYVKAYDAIRKLMCNQQLAKIRGYQPKHFSFNVEGGRCENCKGDGEITVEMQFLADVKLVCEDCKGKRFKNEVLEVKYQGKNIYDILELSIEEALDFFAKSKDIVSKIKPLSDVGLSYIKLGQSSSTLSGGEAQRVKLASYLVKERSSEQILFIFDEPTTGLHFHDIHKLLGALNALVENGHTVLVVEHNLDIIKCADWVIDLGPDAGKTGGYLVFQGTPEALMEEPSSYTGAYLKEKLARVKN